MATFTPQTKNTATFSTQAENASAYVNQVEAQVPVAAGQYIGFGGLNYSGGQTVGKVVWVTQIEN